VTTRQSLAAVATVLLAGAWASSAHVPTAEAPPHGVDGLHDALPVAATAPTPTDQPRVGGSIGVSHADAVAATTLEPVRDSVPVADQLRRYLWRVIGLSGSQRSLHGHIRRVSVGLHLAAIHTDLSSTEADKAIAARICAVVSRFRHSPEGRHVTALDVDVYGRDGQLLAVHEDLSDRTVASVLSGTPRSTGTVTATPAVDIRPTRTAPPSTYPPDR
jgi:hypothetical protein